MNKYTKLADQKTIEATVQALKERNINAEVVENGEVAKQRVLELIPEGSEVMTATSTTLNELGLTEELNDSGKFNSTKNELKSLSRETDHRQMQRIGAAPQYIVGSIHAVTIDGVVYDASNSGSQLPGYSYGADHVIWVVSTKKIVQNHDEAIERIYEHILPLESERANKAYNITSGSNVSKLLIFYKEPRPDRINLIFVKEDLGF
jgi:L-lactate utilization protein LutC